MSVSRRRFTRTLVTAAAVPLLPTRALAQTPTPAASPSPSPSPTPEPPSSAAEALTEVVRIRWGKHLTGDQLGEVARSIDGRLKGAERMKQVKLTNAEEPDIVFAASVR